MKNINIFIMLMCAAIVVTCFIACSTPAPVENNVHYHTYAAEWSKTDTEHYKKADCEHTDEEAEREVHKFGTDGSGDTCTVCGYSKATTPGGISLVHTLNGVALGEYKIVYGKDNAAAQAVAGSLAEKIESYTGAQLECVSDETAKAEHEIVVGDTARFAAGSVEGGKFAITADGGSVRLSANDSSGLIAAAERLARDLFGGNVDYSENSATDEYADLGVKVMSFNLRVSGENRWARLRQIILRNNPDILGTQECNAEWQNMLKINLDGYGWIGEGRDGEDTEACYILYKTSKFTLMDSGTRWYSDTPTTVGSKYPESTFTRIFNYARFLRKSDGAQFVMINTHLDLNQSARLKAVDMLLDFAEQNFAGLPLFITGDFNTDVNWRDGGGYELPLEEYDVDDKLVENGFLNARLTAVDTDDSPTFPTNMYPSDREIYTDRIIDFCFFKGNVFADKYYVDNVAPTGCGDISGLGSDASDHYPIIVEATLYKNL